MEVWQSPVYRMDLESPRALKSPAGSNPAASAIFHFAPMVQLVEHFLGKEEVAGSTPAGSSIFYAVVAQLDPERLVADEEVVSSSLTYRTKISR